eukprot:m.195645 g.195645  ORF g.195645 m.195645 type:complete len:284 (+) comp14893_c0_seq6:73-924(+)
MRRLLLSGLVVGGAIAGCATACYSHRTPHLQPYRLQWLQPERCFAQSPESTTLGFFGQHGYWSERFQPMIEHNTTEEWTTSLTHPKVAEAFEALDKNGLVLHAGTGMSLLPLELHSVGFHKQVCFDYCDNAVEFMAQHMRSHGITSCAMAFHTWDVTSIANYFYTEQRVPARARAADPSLPLQPPYPRPSCIVDKGLLDPLLELEREESVVTSAGDIIQEYARVLKVGGVLLCFAYGEVEQTIKFFEDEANHSLRLESATPLQSEVPHNMDSVCHLYTFTRVF